MATMIRCSPLTGAFYQGRVNKAGDCFIGEKRDVSNDVLRAIIEKAEFHDGCFEIRTGTRSWVVTVKEEK